jgi:hypothetical protein
MRGKMRERNIEDTESLDAGARNECALSTTAACCCWMRAHDQPQKVHGQDASNTSLSFQYGPRGSLSFLRDSLGSAAGRVCRRNARGSRLCRGCRACSGCDRGCGASASSFGRARRARTRAGGGSRCASTACPSPGSCTGADPQTNDQRRCLDSDRVSAPRTHESKAA